MMMAIINQFFRIMLNKVKNAHDKHEFTNMGKVFGNYSWFYNSRLWYTCSLRKYDHIKYSLENYFKFRVAVFIFKFKKFQQSNYLFDLLVF